MPKKFGTNTKAQEANERKSAVKKEAQQKEKKAKEDAMWEDNDKSVVEKEKKKKYVCSCISLCARGSG